MMTSVARPIEILLIEDNPGDIRLLQEALKQSKVPNHLHVVKDGTSALSFLRREEGYAKSARPQIILLDLNLPSKDGREVLSIIKTDPDLMRIPVVVLTTSSEEMDVIQAYDHHANTYVTKPENLAQFIEIVNSIEDFWLQIVTLPSD